MHLSDAALQRPSAGTDPLAAAVEAAAVMAAAVMAAAVMAAAVMAAAVMAAEAERRTMSHLLLHTPNTPQRPSRQCRR
ncbi:MAG: hypothetical protein IPO30_13720 [Hyphomonadaceae bacterium]|nr:hypothetical protein [Hyphomonadaceae bacterium]MBP9234569.1 hypothetical protein [Hyphomonadaceae bacterium]